MQPDTPLPAQDRETFIIRVWRTAAESRAWRGQIQNVRTGQVVNVPDLGQLLYFLHRQIDQDNLAGEAASSLK